MAGRRWQRAEGFGPGLWILQLGPPYGANHSHLSPKGSLLTPVSRCHMAEGHSSVHHPSQPFPPALTSNSWVWILPNSLREINVQLGWFKTTFCVVFHELLCVCVWKFTPSESKQPVFPQQRKWPTVGSGGDPCLAWPMPGRCGTPVNQTLRFDPDLLRVWKTVNVEYRSWPQQTLSDLCKLAKKQTGERRCQNRNKETVFFLSFFPPSVHLDIRTFSAIGRDCEGRWLHQMLSPTNKSANMDAFDFTPCHVRGGGHMLSALYKQTLPSHSCQKSL